MPVFNHTAHKKLWDSLAKNRSWAKRSAIEKLKLPIPKFNACYACDYAAEVYAEKIYPEVFSMYMDYDGLACSYCPLQWSNGQGCKVDLLNDDEEEIVNQYALWISSDELGDEDAAVRLAEEIRDLPVREGVETI